MIFIVNSENRSLFAHDLELMHRHRKAIFVDRLGWNVRAHEGAEIDEYDRENTIYLLAKADLNGELLASARLLPTTGPHLFSDHFSQACAGAIPRGRRVWEASRFCPSPALATSRARVMLLWSVIGGIVETALLHGITRITFTANSALLPAALAAGWQTSLLGPTLCDGDDSITGVCAAVTAGGLNRIKARIRHSGPITRLIVGVGDLKVAA